MNAWDFFISGTVGLFSVVNPCLIVPPFLGFTASHNAGDRRIIALKSTLLAAGILGLFAIVGDSLLEFLEISHGALMVGGGILLFYSGFTMVTGYSSKNSGGEAAPQDPTVFPIAFPLITGPGSMSMVMGKLATVPDTWVYKGVMLGSIGLIMGTTFLALLFGSVILRFLGNAGVMIMQRLMGLIVAALATQLVISGIGREIEASKSSAFLNDQDILEGPQEEADIRVKEGENTTPD